MIKVLTFGVFDYFHLGHLRLFKQMKEYGDYIVVAVQNEDYIRKFKPEAKVLYTTEERVELIDALEIVDKVVTFDSVGADAVSGIDFDILALGEDHLGKRFDEASDWCIKHDKKVIRLKRTPGITSSSIKKHIVKDLNKA